MVSKRIRRLCAGGLYWDCDIVNAFPSILAQLAAKLLGRCPPALSQYHLHCEETIYSILETTGWHVHSYATIETCFLVAMQGGNYQSSLLSPPFSHPFLDSFSADLATVREGLWFLDDPRVNSLRQEVNSRMSPKSHPWSALLSVLCQSTTRRLIALCFSHISTSAPDLSPEALIFDGFLVPRHGPQSRLDSLLKECELQIKEVDDLSVSITVTEVSPDSEDLSWLVTVSGGLHPASWDELLIFSYWIPPVGLNPGDRQDIDFDGKSWSVCNPIRKELPKLSPFLLRHSFGPHPPVPACIHCSELHIGGPLIDMVVLASIQSATVFSFFRSSSWTILDTCFSSGPILTLDLLPDTSLSDASVILLPPSPSPSTLSRLSMLHHQLLPDSPIFICFLLSFLLIWRGLWALVPWSCQVPQFPPPVFQCLGTMFVLAGRTQLRFIILPLFSSGCSFPPLCRQLRLQTYWFPVWSMPMAGLPSFGQVTLAPGEKICRHRQIFLLCPWINGLSSPATTLARSQS